MSNEHPSACITRFIDLPLSNLHIMEAGAGDPLIIVPATISELENWIDLIQFMAQWFHVYFFELPGHGMSSPFQERFSSQLVAELVEQLANELGHERFNLMGFSFGGILAMRTFKRLSYRINRLIMIAPCLDHRAILIPAFRRSIIYHANELMGIPGIQRAFYNLIHNEHSVRLVLNTLDRVGRLERIDKLERKLLKTSESTVSVLSAQIREIFKIEFDVEPQKYDTPCYFSMSINDPLLCFEDTLTILQRHFSDVSTLRVTYPYHQPPEPFTFEELNRDFYETVNSFVGAGRTDNALHVEQVTNLKS